MSKTIIEVKCYDQVLTLTNTPVIASGGVGEDFVSAEFCEKWDGFTVSLLFWRQGVDPIPVLADADGLYQVPPELTAADGVVYFGAVGADPNGVRRTSEGISYRIQAGAITENTTLPEPDGDVFTQLLAQYADVKLYVAERVDVAVDAATTAGNNAQAAQVAAEEAKQHAEDAVDAIADASWRTVTFIPYDGSRHTLAEAQVKTMLPLPAEMDLTLYNYEYEVIAFGLAVVGQTSYNTNVPSIYLTQEALGDRISIGLYVTQEMTEDGIVPDLEENTLCIQRGWLSMNQRKFEVSGSYYGVNKWQAGYACVKGYSDISDAYEWYSNIYLSSYAPDTTQTYGLFFRYRPFPKE